MSNKIEIDIPGYGKRYCSDNVQYYLGNDYFYFYYLDKNNNRIFHNEYGPAYEWKNGSYQYYINNKLHRLDGPAYYDTKDNYKKYHINGFFIGITEEEFLQYKAKHFPQIKNTSNHPVSCKKCSYTNEYAEPNQSDGSFICSQCRLLSSVFAA